MANKAVFLDRDNTLIKDPGYLSDPDAVKLLPGVELAIKSLAQCDYKIVVVTNQSGIARGLLTEEAVDQIHGELRRQLADTGAHVDGIYYCPYHPEGTVEQYAKDSDLRKPQPGMLLKAAEDLGLDLSQSWMVGDSARDIEAGQRAGCRTVRVRTRPNHHSAPGEEDDEDVQADFTVRNLVDAARVILRAAPAGGTDRPARPTAAAKVVAAKPAVASEVGLSTMMPSSPADQEGVPAAGAEAEAEAEEQREPVSAAEVRMEILRYVRQLARSRDDMEEFSFTKLFGSIVQVLALLGLVIVFIKMLTDAAQDAELWAMVTIALQVMALTLFTIRRPR